MKVSSSGAKTFFISLTILNVIDWRRILGRHSHTLLSGCITIIVNSFLLLLCWREPFWPASILCYAYSLCWSLGVDIILILYNYDCYIVLAMSVPLSTDQIRIQCSSAIPWIGHFVKCYACVYCSIVMQLPGIFSHFALSGHCCQHSVMGIFLVCSAWHCHGFSLNVMNVRKILSVYLVL